MGKTRLVFQDAHREDKTTKTPRGSDSWKSQAGGYSWWREAVVLEMGHVPRGSLVASKVLFLDLVVVTRLFL